MRCLEKAADRRPRDMREVEAVLRSVEQRLSMGVTAPSLASPPSGPPEAGPGSSEPVSVALPPDIQPARRSNAAWIAFAVVALAVAVGGIWHLLTQERESTMAPQPAVVADPSAPPPSELPIAPTGAADAADAADAAEVPGDSIAAREQAPAADQGDEPAAPQETSQAPAEATRSHPSATAPAPARASAPSPAPAPSPPGSASRAPAPAGSAVHAPRPATSPRPPARGAPAPRPASR